MSLAPPEPPLSDGVIWLRPYEDGDVSWVRDACRDAEIQRWLPLPEPYSDADARDYVQYSRTAWRAGTSAPFAILDEAGRGIGSIELRLREPDLGEIGYWVAREARGQGVATRAVRLVSRWGIERLGLARVQLTTHPENVVSQRVARRAGFKREGVLRAWLTTREGRRDAVMFSLVPSDLA